MKVALICFSLTGQQTGERLCRGLEAAGMTAELDKKSKYLPDSIQISTSAWAGEKFSDSDALIFIGATGIAVRSIAPYVASKKSDPAVLVVDECGKFVISLLSGHLGGANELALKTAEILKREKPDIIFLCNPNNPTGITIPQDLLEEILETCAMQGIFMVVDECFLNGGGCHSIL